MSQQSEGLVFGGRQSLSGPPAAEKPNDVEIICLNQTLRQFGENIESKLKSLGLAVDVLFPNPDIPMLDAAIRTLGCQISSSYSYPNSQSPKENIQSTLVRKFAKKR